MELCTPAFNRMVKVFFKYKCPHRQGKNPNSCVQCVEIDKGKHTIKRSITNPVYKHREYEFSLLQRLESEGLNEWAPGFSNYRKLLSDRIYLLIREIIKGTIDLKKLYQYNLE